MNLFVVAVNLRCGGVLRVTRQRRVVYKTYLKRDEIDISIRPEVLTFKPDARLELEISSSKCNNISSLVLSHTGRTSSAISTNVIRALRNIAVHGGESTLSWKAPGRTVEGAASAARSLPTRLTDGAAAKIRIGRCRETAAVTARDGSFPE